MQCNTEKYKNIIMIFRIKLAIVLKNNSIVKPSTIKYI